MMNRSSVPSDRLQQTRPSSHLPGLRIQPAERFQWHSRFGGMGASDAASLRGLNADNAKLKRLLAEVHQAIEAFLAGKTRQALDALATAKDIPLLTLR